MNALKKILPNTLFGKALFLLVIARIIGMFYSSLSANLYMMIKFLESYPDKVSTFNIEHSDGGWIVFLSSAFFQTIFSTISIFLVGAIELAIVWMIVYVVFRMARNGTLKAKSFFAITVITLFIEHILVVVNCAINVFINTSTDQRYSDLFSFSTIDMIVIFTILTSLAYWIFLSNKSSDERELPKDYLKRMWYYLPECKLLLCLILGMFLVRFCNKILPAMML